MAKPFYPFYTQAAKTCFRFLEYHKITPPLNTPLVKSASETFETHLIDRLPSFLQSPHIYKQLLFLILCTLES